jgi:hypothetical protein
MTNVSRWVGKSRNPSAEAAVQIRRELQKIEPAAAEDFVMLDMYESGEDEA